jgi:hypothetical protein
MDHHNVLYHPMAWHSQNPHSTVEELLCCTINPYSVQVLLSPIPPVCSLGYRGLRV